MEKTLEELSTSALRNLLNAEVRKFIIALDRNSITDLEQMKLQLRRIYNIIAERERIERAPLVWSKNSKFPSASSQPDADLSDGAISQAQTA